jgi:phosphoglycolate phosphatase
MPPMIVFDLDGTLVESAPDIMATLNHLLVREGITPLPLSAARSLVGAGARALLERGYKAAGHPLTPERLDLLFEDFLEYYLEHIADHSTLFDGVKEALETLAAQGHTLAICTNKPEKHAQALVQALGIRPFFAAVAGRETFPYCKPDPRHLTETIRLAGQKFAGGEGRHAIMVGDSITDIETARAAKIPVIGVTFGYTPTPMAELGADVVIEHFDALEAAIKSL